MEKPNTYTTAVFRVHVSSKKGTGEVLCGSEEGSITLGWRVRSQEMLHGRGGNRGAILDTHGVSQFVRLLHTLF